MMVLLKIIGNDNLECYIMILLLLYNTNQMYLTCVPLTFSCGALKTEWGTCFTPVGTF